MWARVSRAKVAPEKLDAVVGFFRDIPRTSFEGMTDAQVLVDRAQSNITTVTYWGTEGEMKASAQGANEVRAKAAATVDADISWEVEEFEVAA